MSRFLFLLGVSLFPVSASAQDAGDTGWEDQAHYGSRPAPDDAVPVVVDPVDLAPITVTARGIATPVAQTGQAITIVGTAEIDSVQGSDPERVLRRVPGLTLSRNGGQGSFTGVRLRGAEAEQLLVLIDGVRVADQAAPGGGYDFGNLAMGTVGSLDVLRGANSTIWGSDAIGGVMAIATRDANGMLGSVEYGARDTFAANLSAGVSTGRLFAGISGGWLSTDGFSAAASGSEPDGFRQFAIGARLRYDLTDRLEVFANGNVRESHLEIDGFPPPDYALADTLETQDTSQHSAALGFGWWGEALTLRGSYSIADTARANFNDDGTASFDSEGREERVDLRGEYLLVGYLKFAFGGEHGWSSYAVSYDAPARAKRTGGYAQVGWESDALSAHAGARVEDHQGFGTATSFGADVSYRIGGDWRLRASVGEGFKAPTLYQLFSFYGTPALAPEESIGGDIGIEHGLRGKGLHLSLTAFRRDSDNLIGFSFDDPARPFGAYANVARARAQGIEAEAGVDVLPGLRVSGVYSLTDAEDSATGLDLARRPRHAATLFADWESGFGLGLGADLRIVSGSFDNAANTVRLGGYEVVDLRAGFALTDDIALFARVENVFDTDYQTASGYASTPRGVFAGVRAGL